LSVFSRPAGVFVLTAENLRHEYHALGVQTAPEVLWVQFVKSVGAFNYFGETSVQYGQTAPLLDHWSAVLSVLGLALTMARARHPSCSLVGTWFWLTVVLGSVLTVDAMFSPHIVAALGIIAVLPALALDSGWRILETVFVKWGKPIAVTLVTVFSALIVMANYVDYFQIHTNTMEPEGFYTFLARYVNRVNMESRVYLLGDSDTSLRYDTAVFLVPHVDGVDVHDSELRLPLDRLPDGKGVVFILREPADTRLAAIRATYPNGVLATHESRPGVFEFTSYTVSQEALLAAAPDALVDPASVPTQNLGRIDGP
jgi:hypothetical protein